MLSNVGTHILPVYIKGLKPKDIQHSNGGPKVSWIWLRLENGSVDLFNNPYKHTTINALHKGISHIHRSVYPHGSSDTLTAGDNGFCCQSIYQILCFYLKINIKRWTLTVKLLIFQFFNKQIMSTLDDDLGPVVQSIVSLTSSLVAKMLTVLVNTISNS